MHAGFAKSLGCPVNILDCLLGTELMRPAWCAIRPERKHTDILYIPLTTVHMKMLFTVDLAEKLSGLCAIMASYQIKLQLRTVA